MGVSISTGTNKIIDLLAADSTTDNQGEWNDLGNFVCKLGAFDYVVIEFQLLEESGNTSIALSEDTFAMNLTSPQVDDQNLNTAFLKCEIFNSPSSASPGNLSAIFYLYDKTGGMLQTQNIDIGISNGARIHLMMYNTQGVIVYRYRIYKITR